MTDSTKQPPERHEEIMWATHQAISKHGYADLTMRNIAAESSKSHSLLTYHYDTKANLVREYLEFLISLLQEHVEDEPTGSPLERIETFLDYFTVGTDVFPRDLQVAFLELQMASLRDDELREILTEHNRDNFQLLADIIDEGRARGSIREDVDSNAMANLLLSAVIGASEQETVNDFDLVTDVRGTLRTVVVDDLGRTHAESEHEDS